jgi:hypothetical protein
MSHWKRYIDPTSLQLELQSILRLTAQYGLRRALNITMVSPFEFYRMFKVALNLNIDWNFIDPHGGRLSLKMSHSSRFRIK